MAGIYWVGSDNNTYYKGGGGDSAPVLNLGKGDQRFHPLIKRGATLVDDPNPGGGVLAASTTAPSSGGGGGSAPPVLNQAAVDATQASLASLDTILANALASSKTGYTNAITQLDEQEKQERGRYDEGTVGNMKNYDSNLAASLRAGRSGRAGLMAALRGGGGSGNSFARDWVENTVGDTTSNDIREGYNTYDENRNELDTSLSTLLTGLKGKRQQNEDTLANNERAARLYDAQQRQDLLQKLAGIYGEAERPEASTYIAQAGSYAPTIAQNMGAQVSSFDATPVEVKAPDVTAFSAPEQKSMGATPNQSTGVFSLTDPRRRKQEQLAGV